MMEQSSNITEEDIGCLKLPDQTLVDISAYIDACASTLTVDDPLFYGDSSFSLHDSMAALELMDPSMDCCEVAKGTTTTTKTTTTLPWHNLSFSQVSIISLESLITLVSLLEGSSVAESIYTCLYAHDDIFELMRQHCCCDDNHYTSTTPQYCLFAILLGLLRLTDTIRSIVEHADLYEEEDFNLNAFGFTFQRQIYNDTDAIRILTQAVQALGINQEQEEEQDKSIRSNKAILLHILHFQINLLQCCKSFLNMTTTNHDNSNNTLQHTIQEVFQFAKNSEHALLGLLMELKQQQPQLMDFKQMCFDSGVNRQLMGNIPVRKVSNFKQTFEEAILSLKEISSDLGNICCVELLQKASTNTRRTLNALKRISFSFSCNILVRSIIGLNLYFSDKIHGQHYLSDWISDSMNVMYCGIKYNNNITNDDLPVPQSSSIVLPPPPVENNNNYGNTLLLNRLGKPIYDSLKLLVMNRCRQRALISEHYLKDWALLHKDANAVDYHVAQQQASSFNGCCTTTNWVLLHTLWLMEQYLGLSIDTGLVHEHQDLVMTYWYWSFLNSAHLNVMNSLLVAASSRQQQQKQYQQQQYQQQHQVTDSNTRRYKLEKASSKKKNVKNTDMERQQQDQQQPTAQEVSNTAWVDIEFEMEHLLVGVLRSICKGIFQSIIACYQAGILKPSPTEQKYRFTSNEIIFNKRFEAFRVISQPPRLTYNDFVHGSDYSRILLEDLIGDAADSFNIAKAMLDKILAALSSNNSDYDSMALNSPIQKSEALCLVKVCIGNKLFLHKLLSEKTISSVASATAAGGISSKNGTEKCTLTVEFDFTVHKQFCLLKLK